MKSALRGAGLLAAACLAACGGSGGGDSLDSGGDFGSGRIFAIPEDSADGVVPDELLDTSHGIVTFATGEDGELYFADFFVGTIHRIDPAP